MPPTIKDVAVEAQVSVATVSRVVNGSASVRPTVRQRVEAAVGKLGYQPNALASGLRRKSTLTVGLVVNNIYNPFYAELTKGVEDVARLYGYSIILCNSGTNPEQERRYLEVLLSRRVDGIIISPTGGNRKAFERVVANGVPMVQVDRQVPGLQVDTVVVDNRQGVREAILHLVALGHRRIGAIVGPSGISTGRERLAGYLESLQEAGLPVIDELVKEGDFLKQSGYRLFGELMSLGQPPTAVFTANNEMAAGSLLAARERGLRLPDDLAFVTYDDPDWSVLVDPPLTVVRQPVYAVGTTAANRLFDHLRQPEVSGPVHVVLAPQLIIRRSSGVKQDHGSG